LPAKRWQPPESARLDERPALAMAAAERVAREELGLVPATDVTLSPARSAEFTTHGISETKKIRAFGETDYIHSLFDATLVHSEKLQSDHALAWVTPTEIHERWTGASHGEQRAPQGPAGRISRTAYEILVHGGSIPEDDDPDVDELANQMIARMRSREGIS
jgi:hypothetical protein